MTLTEIKDAVDAGKTVYWKQTNYIVIKSRTGEYLIQCKNNNDCIGLAGMNNNVMNGNENDFHLSEEK